jgi:hypothetical protein
MDIARYILDYFSGLKIKNPNAHTTAVIAFNKLYVSPSDEYTYKLIGDSDVSLDGSPDVSVEINYLHCKLILYRKFTRPYVQAYLVTDTTIYDKHIDNEEIYIMLEKIKNNSDEHLHLDIAGDTYSMYNH